MKLKTKIIASLILATFTTILISRQMNKGNTLDKLLINTPIADLNGVNVKKNEFRHKVVILSYFQTWCGDCVKEQPDLVRLKEKFGEDISILLVSDENVEQITAFKNKFQYPLNFYHTSTQLKKGGIVSRFPTTYLFNKKGEIMELKIEGTDWYTPEIITKIEQSLGR